MNFDIFSDCPKCNLLRTEYLNAWMDRGEKGVRVNHVRLTDAARKLNEHEWGCPIANGGLYQMLWKNAVVAHD